MHIQTERKLLVMKMVILIVLVMAGGVLHADAVFARGGAGGGGAPGGGTGGGPAGGGGAPAGGGSVPGDTGTAAATGPDSSALETGPGDRLGGPSAGYAGDPSIYHSPATAWPGEIEYLSASPRDPAVVAPPAAVAPTAVIVTPQSAVVVQSPARVDIRATPLMCPGINASDPRKC